jgi:hydrogenase nickel incorporation protein HypA/HybF
MMGALWPGGSELHEMSITQSLLDLAMVEAEKARATRITAIHLRIGVLTGVVAESVSFYLDFLAKGTPAEGAKLVATVVPVTARCTACGTTFPADDLIFTCPECGGKAQVAGGRELFMESLEVE